ncbi:MAG: hypothetical protein KJO30_02575, partial [Boseongicola sp.]|nr:hypothetical protein [Boseongicola sp.]NNJ66699.1 hypothetical protein [Boseongicola sp.]
MLNFVAAPSTLPKKLAMLGVALHSATKGLAFATGERDKVFGFRKHHQTRRMLPMFTRAILASAGIFAATLASAQENVPFALDWKFEGP